MVSFDEQTHYHDEFQKSGIYDLEHRGYQVEDGTYHNKFSAKTQQILQRMNYDITGLYIKGWADNYIFKDGYAALIEWKAQETKREPWNGKKTPNASIEATQYAFHYYLAQSGVNVIYAYWDKFYYLERGFVIEKGNPFNVVNRLVRFPVKADNNPITKQKQIDFLKYVFGDAILFQDKPSGDHVSPDPYFLIMSEKLEKLENWMDLIP